MTYLSIVSMAGSPSLISRITAAVAQEGYQGDPSQFVSQNIWVIVSKSSLWDQAWSSAKANPSINVNPDTGIRDDVITDNMILAVIQPMVTPVAAEAEEPVS